ncbi:hypothetical protein [Fodinicola acaciae]|uniref:hypothetical protein n=1 Tax=Fodinicola acaciae TaxID=2681555 RepID=UPI0013D1D206|nr:hypothetical protein [Fodinicola acaciae]
MAAILLPAAVAGHRLGGPFDAAANRTFDRSDPAVRLVRAGGTGWNLAARLVLGDPTGDPLLRWRFGERVRD